MKISAGLYRNGLSASDSVYLQLRDALIHGEFPPGAVLSERRLSEKYTVSRTPVREALRKLQDDGLVQASGRNQIVSVLSQKEARDVYRARSAFEALAASLAAERMRDGYLAPVQIQELKRLAQEVDAAAAEGDARLAALQNLRFHKAVAEMGDNWVVIDALNRVWDRIAVASLSNLTDQAWDSEVHRHHESIIRAISDGDPVLAAGRMRNHIDRAATVYITHETEEDYGASSTD
ncbi:GntR family transcriptional regulator [Microbacterium soli]